MCVCVQVQECCLCFYDCLAPNFNWARFIMSIFFLLHRMHKYFRCCLCTWTSLESKPPSSPDVHVGTIVWCVLSAAFTMLVTHQTWKLQSFLSHNRFNLWIFHFFVHVCGWRSLSMEARHHSAHSQVDLSRVATASARRHNVSSEKNCQKSL